MAEWQTLALYWYGGPAGPADALARSDLRPAGRRSICSRCRPGSCVAGWLTTLAVLVCIATVLVAVSRAARACSRGAPGEPARGRRCGRLDRVRRRAADDRRRRSTSAASTGSSTTARIFAGVTYTDAHVTLTGMLSSRARSSLGALVAGRQRRHGADGCAGSIAAVVPADRLLRRRRHRRLVRQQLRRQAERTGARTPVHRAQHRDDATGVRARPDRAAAVPRRDAASKPSTPPTIRRRCRTSGCGTGARCRTRCGRFRKSAPTTTSPTSTSIATRSTARSGR